MLTHFPKDPNCPVCNSCKRNRAYCKSKVHGEPDDLPEPQKFADAVTADHKILNEDDESRKQDRVALIVLDRFTKWLQGYAAKSKAHDEVMRDLQRFLGPQVKPQHVFTDNSKEFIKALEELNWPHDTSTPNRPQTNGIIERCVRVVKEGTSCVMVQSGLADKWWPEAMNCFCFLRNATLVLDTGVTPYKNRFGSDFSGPLIPFGAEIEYYPITSKLKAKQHAFGDKMRRAIFIGYAQHAGGGWTEDLLLIDAEEVAAAQHFSDINIQRFNHKEVTPKLQGEEFKFPLAEGSLRQPGVNPRTDESSDPFESAGGASPSSDDDDDDGDTQWNELEPFDPEEDGQPKADPDLERPEGARPQVDETATKDYWSFNGEVLTRHHVVPRSTLFVPTDPECPIPTRFLDICRRTYTDLGNAKENFIEDYWNVQAARVLSDNWMGKTVIPILLKPPKPGWEVIYGRPTKIQKTQRPGNLWPEEWIKMNDARKKKAIEFWKSEEPLRKKARDLRGLYVIKAEDFEEYD